MESKLKHLIRELDFTLGSIGLRVETLSDMQTVLGRLRQSMDEAVHRGEERYYYREHHREVRLLADLMYYTMKELNEKYEKAQELNQSFFEAIYGKGGESNQAQPA